jgi:hypothetical protein
VKISEELFIDSKDKLGLHRLLFNEKKHKYILDGNHIPGATTFCKGGYPTSEALISWQKGQAASYALDIGFQLGLVGEPLAETRKKEIIKEAKKKDKEAAKSAAAIGTLVHEWCYQLETKGNPSEELVAKIMQHPDRIKIENGINKFTEWKKGNQDEIVLSESIVASLVHNYGGKFDCLRRRNGILILSDFKTSSAIYLDYFIQLGAYCLAVKEWLGLSPLGLEVLRFGKEDGEFQTMLIDDPNEIKAFEEQAIECRKTYKFRLEWENDERFKWKGAKS